MTDDGSHGDLRQSEAEWLSLLRYQLSVALEQARMPAPLNALAINTLQDSVEGLLALAADHLRASVKNRADFLQLFDAVVAETDAGDNLAGFRQAVASMNTARVGFKHHGNAPSDPTIRRHVDRAREFMEALTESAFGRPLESVGLLLFVQNEDVRKYLEEARARWSSGDRPQAMHALRQGFDQLVRDFEQRKVWNPGNSLFSTKPSFAPRASQFGQLGREFEMLVEWLESIDQLIKHLAVGVDMRRYAYFQAHTPVIIYTINGHIAHHRHDSYDDGDAFERCFKFVIDTALDFAADDFDFDPWTARLSRESGA